MEHTNKSDVLRQGVIVFIFLAALTALEFFVAIQIGSTVLLAMIAFVKVGLVMYYYMHIYKLSVQDDNLDRHSYEYKLTTSRMGLWLFLLSDAFIFGGLFISRFNLLGLTALPLSPDSQYIALTITSVLLLSSFFMNRAEVSMEHGDRKGFIVGISLTILLGLVFLAGVITVEWPSAINAGRDAVLECGGCDFLYHDGYARLPCFDRRDLPQYCFAEWIARAYIPPRNTGQLNRRRSIGTLSMWFGFSFTRPCI